MKGTRRRMSGMLTDVAMGIKKVLHPEMGVGKKWSRKLLPLLVITLVCSNIGSMMPYGAERVTKQIEEFEELPEDVLYQQVPEGTKKMELNLPKNLRGFVVSESSADGVDTATQSDAKKYIASPSEAVKKEDADVTVATSSTATKTEEGEWKNIRVVWELDVSFSDGEEYDGKIPGTYVFDAVLARDTYQLASAELPRITVEVLPNPTDKVIADWEWIDELDVLSGNVLALPGTSETNKADFEIIASMLPENINAALGDEEIPERIAENKTEVPIENWKCDDLPEQGAYEGEYIFEASLPEGYSLKKEVRPLQIKVRLGGASLFTISESDIIVGGLILNDSDKYGKVDMNGAVIPGTDIDHSIYWNAENGTLELTKTDLSMSVDTAPAYDAAILADRKNIKIILNGENSIHIENNINAGFSAIKNSGGGISIEKGSDHLNSLLVSIEQKESLTAGDVIGIYSADGFENSADMEIDIQIIPEKTISKNMTGIQCGIYSAPAKDAFKNRGNIKVSVNIQSLSTWYGVNAQGINIYQAGMENSGDMDISVITTNGKAFGLYGSSISEQWSNFEEGTIRIETAAYGGNVDGMDPDTYMDSNHSSAVSINAYDDIFMLNCGTMDLKALNFGNNERYEHAIGLSMDGHGEVILDNQGELNASGLEGYSYGIKLTNTLGDTILKNSGIVIANATTDGEVYYDGATALATGIGINSDNFDLKPGVTAIQTTADSMLTAFASASEIIDSSYQDEVTENYCQAVQLQKMYSKNPDYSKLPQEIELEDGSLIRKGGKCFTVWLEDYVDYGMWIYINTIGEDEVTGPAKYVEIGPAIIPTIIWPEVNLTYGESLADGKMTGQEALDENGRILEGEFIWSDDTIIPSVKDSQVKTFRMLFKPSAGYGELYSEMSEDLLVTVAPKKLSLSFDAIPPETQAGKDVNLQVNVNGIVGGGTLEGRIRFSADGTVIGESSVGAGNPMAAAVWKNPAEGIHTLNAEYIPAVFDNYIGDGSVSIDDYKVIAADKPEDNPKPVYSDDSSDDGYYHTPVSNGQWVKDSQGWRWQYTSSRWAQGRKETDVSGKLKEYYHWELIDGAWFPFDADGYMKVGLIFDANYDGWFYIDINAGMKTSWQMIDGKWYYFNTVSDGRRGIMLVDTWVDGWYVDKNGIWDGKEKEE